MFVFILIKNLINACNVMIVSSTSDNKNKIKKSVQNTF